MQSRSCPVTQVLVDGTRICFANDTLLFYVVDRFAKPSFNPHCIRIHVNKKPAIYKFHCATSPGLHSYSRKNVLKTECPNTPNQLFPLFCTRTVYSELTLVFEHFKGIMLTWTRFRCSAAILDTASKRWLVPYSHAHQCHIFKIVFISCHYAGF